MIKNQIFKHMKTNLLFLLLVIVPFCLVANDLKPKDKYATGKVFLLNNDTVNVYIKVETLYNMQNGIQYVDTMGVEHVLKPSEAKGFSLIYPSEIMIFESRHDLTKVVFQPRNPDHYFVPRILEGKLTLYYFIEKKLVMDGIEQVEAEKARYLVRYSEEWYPVTKEYFNVSCRKIFTVLKREGFGTQIKALVREFDAEKYQYEDTPALINKCNQLITPVQN